MKEIIMNSVGIDAIEYQQWLKNLFEEIDRQRLICDSLPKNIRIFHLCKFRLHNYGKCLFFRIDLRNSLFRLMAGLCKCRLHKSPGIAAAEK